MAILSWGIVVLGLWHIEYYGIAYYGIGGCETKPPILEWDKTADFDNETKKLQIWFTTIEDFINAAAYLQLQLIKILCGIRRRSDSVSGPNLVFGRNCCINQGNFFARAIFMSSKHLNLVGVVMWCEFCYSGAQISEMKCLL